MEDKRSLWVKYSEGNLVLQIVVGIIAGVLTASLVPAVAPSVAILGSLFVGALKAVAPILVFVLIATAIATKSIGSSTNIKPILVLYLVGTFSAALIAVLASFAFPIELVLPAAQNTSLTPPTSVVEVLQGVLFKMVDNPVNALATGNFIGILVWAVAIGIAMHYSNEDTKAVFQDVSLGVTKIVRFIIRLAPFGIYGLVTHTFAETGFTALLGYGKLLLVLVGAMLFVGFVINPIIAFVKIKKNPYPLIFQCVKESGITAFFTRSSAANVPVNMALCKKLNLHEDTYSISIPLGATINMAGAAVTITVLTLAAVHTLGISVDIPTALLLSVVSALAACGASGVAGGSLLLIPLACSLFGINNDIAMQVVTVGFMIGVVQDSLETALNSSTDVVFTAVCDKED